MRDSVRALYTEYLFFVRIMRILGWGSMIFALIYGWWWLLLVVVAFKLGWGWYVYHDSFLHDVMGVPLPKDASTYGWKK